MWKKMQPLYTSSLDINIELKTKLTIQFQGILIPYFFHRCVMYPILAVKVHGSRANVKKGALLSCGKVWHGLPAWSLGKLRVWWIVSLDLSYKDLTIPRL